MIRSIKKEDAERIAKIHQQALPETFLSSLGLSFLTKMYSAQTDDSKSIVFVAEDNEEIVGFISGAIEGDSFIKRIILISPIKLFWKIGIQFLKRPSILGKIFQTLKYGKLCQIERVDTELLAIAVVPGIQRGGIGTDLLNALLVELRQKEVKKLKVLVGQELVSAQSFYKKHNFVLQKTIELYGKKKDILVRDI